MEIKEKGITERSNIGVSKNVSPMPATCSMPYEYLPSESTTSQLNISFTSLGCSPVKPNKVSASDKGSYCKRKVCQAQAAIIRQ
jgi:hypothetical protein